MTNDQQTGHLIDQCERIHRGAGDAIAWVEKVRGNSQRLDRESDSLIHRLRHARNLAHRLGRSAARPVSIGFFGLSQAGKSYLISALAADRDGRLETELDGRRLDFLAHYNPPGRGKEATGLVTRFTRRASPTPDGYPIRLSLFTEADLAKVLGNSFFNDFDREIAPFETDPARIRGQLDALRPRRTGTRTGAMDEDAVTDLMAYFEQRFPRSTEILRGDYWPSAIGLAPYLGPADRAELLSVLWGGIGDLTAVYRMLGDALAATGHADTLYCPLAALVEPEGDGWRPGRSIMNVDVLEHLGRDADDPIELIPERDGRRGEPVRLPRSLLAALTTEIELVLAEPPATGLVEQVDLLDFPGYRGRLDVGDLDEVRRRLGDDQADPVAQLVLRGKVAYLFERYTDDQEMNCLVLCAPSQTQSEVKDLGPVLEGWVRATQGADAETRARRRPGLLWAITKFDHRLEPGPAETPELLRQGWEGMMKLALLERFGTCDWLRQWSPGRSFDNLFLVRKPGMVPAVIQTRDGRELDTLPDQRERLERLRSTFCADPTVRRHIREPEAAWQAMLTPDDGGVSRLSAYLAGVATAHTKIDRIAEQVTALADELVNHRLGPYYRREGPEQLDDKERIANAVVEALSLRPDRIGLLLKRLQPSAEQLRGLYLRTEPAAEEKKGSSLIGRLPGMGGSVPGQAGGDETEPFARGVMREWIALLKTLPDQAGVPAYFGLGRGQMEDLIDELITGADRLGLEREISTDIRGAERQRGARRSQLAGRQAFVAAARIERYVNYLGLGDTPPGRRPRSIAAPDRNLFAPPPPIPPGTLPQLPPDPIDFSGVFIVDWFVALRGLIVGNAGHTTGRDIGPEQNARLGEILATIGGREWAGTGE